MLPDYNPGEGQGEAIHERIHRSGQRAFRRHPAPADASPFARKLLAEASQLRELLALHEAALECMAHGLCMVDAEQRLTLYNRRFIEIFNLLPEVVRVGMPFADADASLGHARELPARADSTKSCSAGAS